MDPVTLFLASPWSDPCPLHDPAGHRGRRKPTTRALRRSGVKSLTCERMDPVTLLSPESMVLRQGRASERWLTHQLLRLLHLCWAHAYTH